MSGTLAVNITWIGDIECFIWCYHAIIVNLDINNLARNYIK